MSEDVIKAEGLTKIFNHNLVAVDHINFSVKQGEIFGFLGPNGAGKTTTINMLITVLKPTEGHAYILGKDIAKENMEVRNSIGVVPQEYTADEDLTGYENILLCADLYGIPREIAKRRAVELLELVELTAFKDKRVQTYSGGMRRRLELACGLINRPKLLFLDEPTLGLDVQTRTATWNYVRKLKKEYGMTLFMTTHYLEEADALCDRIAIIDHGKIIVTGTPEELKESLGGDIITLGIQKDVDITGLVKKIPHVKEVRKENGSYLIKSENGEVTAPLIIEALRKEGHVVTKLSLTKPTLNEVYLQYTGKSMRDAEESPEAVFAQRATMRRARK
ncbi:ATP-binding cassette domain-containing protein [Candidatus Bathyarchaeota archaeon A05DMB-2]|jgi:ABC-2 type transport system ATP-binding protein|nr:ATP-binding cassette domain-containing protein [Candidatus Bathyarchaeota archaeon A05DMB-2]